MTLCKSNPIFSHRHARLGRLGYFRGASTSSVLDGHLTLRYLSFAGLRYDDLEADAVVLTFPDRDNFELAGF